MKLLRWYVARSLAVVGGVVLLALAYSFFAWNSESVLNWRHSLLTEFQRTVVTLNLSGLDTTPLFLIPDDTIITPMTIRHGLWEANETYWFCRSIGPGDTFVDVGANVGYFTVLAAQIVGDSGHIYAFEPNPEAFAMLQKNVRLNGLTNVTLEQKAVSNAPGELELYLATENKGDHRIFQARGESRESVTVETVVLDEYFKGRESEINFIKVDTQGAEGVIVEGMKQIVQTNPQLRIAIEFSPWHLGEFGFDPGKLVDMLEAVEFRSFDLGRGLPRIDPLVPLTPRQALQRYAGKGPDAFTNLLMVRSDVVFNPQAPPVGEHRREATFCPIPKI